MSTGAIPPGLSRSAMDHFAALRQSEYSPRNPPPPTPIDLFAPPPPNVADLLGRLMRTHADKPGTGGESFVDTHASTLAAAVPWLTDDPKQITAVGRWLGRGIGLAPGHLPAYMITHADIPLVAASPQLAPTTLFDDKWHSYVSYDAASLNRELWTVLVQSQRQDPQHPGVYAFFTTASQFPNRQSALLHANDVYAEQQRTGVRSSIFVAAPDVQLPLFAAASRSKGTRPSGL